MSITRLSNIDQLRYICGNVSPEISIKIRASDFSVNTKSAFLQCDGYTKIYTQWFMSHSAYTYKSGGGGPGSHEPAKYHEVDEKYNAVYEEPVICYTTPNINNIDELFEKEYEIVKIVGKVENSICKIHLFCDENQVEELLTKITNDIDMTELTYIQKAQRTCKTFIVLPISYVIGTAFCLLSCSALCITGNWSCNYYLGGELFSYRTGLNMNKRLIVLTKQIWKNNKICCDKLLYSHNTSEINDELYENCDNHKLSLKKVEDMELLIRFDKCAIINNQDVQDIQQELLKNIYPEDKQLRNNELQRIQNINFVLRPDDIEKYVVTNQSNTTYENNQEQQEQEQEQQEQEPQEQPAF